jgi:hypothetical protein
MPKLPVRGKYIIEKQISHKIIVAVCIMVYIVLYIIAASEIPAPCATPYSSTYYNFLIARKMAYYLALLIGFVIGTEIIIFIGLYAYGLIKTLKW